MPVEPSPNDLTRHQLDELDLLLQRMLKLPLASASSEPGQVAAPIPSPDLPSGWRVDSAASARKPLATEAPTRQLASAPLSPVQESKPRLAVDPPEWGPDPLARTSIRPEPAVPTSTPPNKDLLKLFGSTAPEPDQPAVVPTGTLRGVDAPATPVGFRSQMADWNPPQSVEPEPSPIVNLVTSNPPEPFRLAWPLWPLFAVNWLLEAVLGLLGPVGKLFTSSIGKQFLAVIGAILILASALWSAQGLGWLSLAALR